MGGKSVLDGLERSGKGCDEIVLFVSNDYVGEDSRLAATPRISDVISAPSVSPRPIIVNLDYLHSHRLALDMTCHSDKTQLSKTLQMPVFAGQSDFIGKPERNSVPVPERDARA